MGYESASDRISEQVRRFWQIKILLLCQSNFVQTIRGLTRA
ncbi:hypothetical protein Q7O_001898 [Pectobacterium carotovorum subsp. carotovorum PCCS1]|nr:hypothetical protein [Pectobacterium carotovorum subsp. carotovorum PCCS1]